MNRLRPKCKYILCKYLLVCLILMTSFLANAVNITVDDIRYSIDLTTKEATVSKQNSSLKIHNLVIPDYIEYDGEQYPVTTISEQAFFNCRSLTGSLTIGNSVTTIGYSAFDRCTGFSGSLTIGNSVTTIGAYAFEMCRGFSGSLTIGNSVITIEDHAFDGCSGFSGSLTIGDSVTNIGDYAFSVCSGFSGSLTIGNSVTTIGNRAFQGCSGFSGSLTIGDSVNNIGDYAFVGCSGFTGSLTVGNSVTIIGNHAFDDCSGFTGSLTIGDSVTIIGNHAFYGCSGFTGSLTIGDSVTTIGDFAFSGCRGFSNSLTIGDSVTTIGIYAFSECSGFTGPLFIPESVITIGNSAFNQCFGFVSLHLGSNLQEIGTSAFSGNRFNEITSEPSNPPTVNNYNFGYTNYEKPLYVPQESVELYKTANVWKEFKYINPIGVDASKISLNKTEASLKVKESIELIATILPENATDKSVTWTSSDEAIATVDADGKVTAVAVGKATITATATSGITATCVITVAETPAGGITIDKEALGITGDNLEMRVGDVKAIKVDVTPETTTDKSVVFESSDPAVASVDEGGNVTALSLGSTIITITAKSNADVKATLYVTVVATPAGAISLNKTEASLKATETVDLVATILPETTTDKSVTWTSSDEAIATVDADGKVTAVAVGKATITATATSGITATCVITVAETPAGGITIDKEALGITGDNLEMRVGDVKAIKVDVTPETTTDKSVVFESSDPAVASVDEGGNVTALSLGSTIITITAKSNADVKATLYVTVVATPAGAISLNKTEASLKATETVDLVATILPETTTDKSVTWRSSDEAIATVDADGKVTAVAVGKATITATAASGISATCVITVAETPAESMTLDCEDATIKVNESVKLNATITPEQTTDKTIVWKSSDDNVASVDVNGVVTGHYSGVVTITATCGSVSASCTVTVIPRETAAITVTRSEELMIIMDGETAEMSVNVSGGYSDGLTFTWSNNGNTVGTANSLRVTGRSNGDSKSNEFYSVRVVDECDGAILLDQTYQFEIETWPRPASDVTIKTGSATDNIKVREGNLLELSSDMPEGGYGANWNFDWYLDGVRISTEQEMSHVMTMDEGTEMSTEDAAVRLTATNFGPDGTVWGEAVSAPVNVTVYRRPLTPRQLVRKGDGTTHTLVAMSQHSDDELARLGYRFVYGYTDASGEEHIVATTGKRYCRIDEQVFNNAGCEKWCYSEWTYADGSVVTSGKRYLDGRADEDFDASDFSGDASPKKAVDFSDSNNWIRSNGKGINISVETTDEARVDVYTVSGSLIDTVIIPANTFTSVDYTAERLTPDFYIISITSAEQKVVKKIIIK